ncbi:MAG: glycoside hydrolase family 5 protein [Candidatus Hydrogenedens sp.]
MERRTFLRQLFSTYPMFHISKLISSGGVDNQREKRIDEKLVDEGKNIWGKFFGFNLLNYFMVHGKKPFQEEEFALIHRLGFNFVRLPMDYRCWTDEESLYQIREEDLKEIDKTIEFGKKYNIHVCLNFHRAPGWTVAKPEETINLWNDEEAQKICTYHWQTFAKRYKDISPMQLSFNLLNEPGNISPEKHKNVIGKLVEVIRNVDEERPIHCDGRFWGAFPPIELSDLGIIANLHMYKPFAITHYKASWVGVWDNVPIPEYPYKEDEFLWDKEGIREQVIKPWKALEDKGVPVFVGEFGAFNQTPHKAVMAWLADTLNLFHEAGWGWSMWNFVGPFGPIDSSRSDVEYEDWEGHKVDRQMLTLLQQSVPSK